MDTIKNLTLAIFAIFATNIALAGGDEWKEMKTFHSVMSKTFHPSEEGNLQPVKDNSADLLAKAKAWQESKIPADYNKEETIKTLAALVAKCEELNKAVLAKQSDAELKRLISEAHDLFHEIAEKCHHPE